MKLSRNSKKIIGIVGAACLLSLYSCQKNVSDTKVLSPLESLGKAVFMSNCIACHNPNPTLDGSIGPAIAGPSLELLESRVLNGSYPVGYKPKRDSGAMPNFPQLKAEIPAIHAYLNTFKK